MIRSERGSALVLTLLFIMLLTTMSTALYLYASKQSMFADSTYTQVAATYVANAGVERAKGLLIGQDPLLNTYGQNPGDGVVDRDDFPVILPISEDIGRYDQNSMGERITDNKQGVGNYSLRIDAAFSEVVDFDLDIDRTVGFDPAQLIYGNPTRVNRLLPGKNLKILVRQGIEVVNAFEFNSKDPRVYVDQMSGTTEYYPVNLANIINPFMGKDVTIELNRTDINPSVDYNHCDAWGNQLALYPNQYPGQTESLIFGDKTGTDAKYFYVRPSWAIATYIVEIQNDDMFNQSDLTVRLIYRESGIEQSLTLCNAATWGGSPPNGKVHALLDFSNDFGLCRLWNQSQTHPLAITLSPPASYEAIIIEVESPSGLWTAPPPGGNGGIKIRITRGIPGEIEMGLRMRTEGMSTGCWYPDYPDCMHPTSDYEPIISLPEHLDHAEYLLTPDMMKLGHRSRIRVNELYTITATGNVEDAVENRQLMVSPVSFLDYARFTQSRLTIAAGGMYAGRVYSQDRIELPPSPGNDVYFFDDVLTSSQVINSASAQFPHGGEIFENVPLIEFPELGEMATYYNSNAASAWVIGSPTSYQEYDLFLGNYRYVDTGMETKFWGLDFSDTIAVYREPDADIMNTESYSYRDAWAPGALGPDTTTLPPDFNGLIIVNGDCHVWGTLHGRAITIVARGNIIIEREIIMGTDELDPDSPEDAMSTSEGMPVHLNMVPLRRVGSGVYEGDIILSKNCPRILRIESGLMAFAGALVTEDDDWDHSGAAIDQDPDHSHPFPYPQYLPTQHRYRWNASGYQPPSNYQYDLNNDGRITDGRDFAIDEIPRIELGEWNEKLIEPGDYLWYLMIVGPFIDRDGAAPGHFAARGFAHAGGAFRNGNTRNYRYDPSIRINSPPFVPVPENTLRIMEWDRAVYDLPN
ncbi:hypothetical protein JXA80_02500 [bacterium]|nr:hypothetical protein [candidate division CSSED10-310 bacterium]